MPRITIGNDSFEKLGTKIGSALAGPDTSQLGEMQYRALASEKLARDLRGNDLDENALASVGTALSGIPELAAMGITPEALAGAARLKMDLPKMIGGARENKYRADALTDYDADKLNRAAFLANLGNVNVQAFNSIEGNTLLNRLTGTMGGTTDYGNKMLQIAKQNANSAATRANQDAALKGVFDDKTYFESNQRYATKKPASAVGGGVIVEFTPEGQRVWELFQVEMAQRQQAGLPRMTFQQWDGNRLGNIKPTDQLRVPGLGLFNQQPQGPFDIGSMLSGQQPAAAPGMPSGMPPDMQLGTQLDDSMPSQQELDAIPPGSVSEFENGQKWMRTPDGALVELR